MSKSQATRFKCLHMGCAGEAGAGGALQLLAGQAGALESLLVCMQRGWMCLLVGAPGSGELLCW